MPAFSLTNEQLMKGAGWSRKLRLEVPSKISKISHLPSRDIHWGATKEDFIKSYSYIEDQDDIKIKSLLPSAESIDGEECDYTGTVFFRPREAKANGPRASKVAITIDKEFGGLHAPLNSASAYLIREPRWTKSWSASRRGTHLLQ